MNTRIQTPQMSKVRDLADSALNTPDGLGVLFLTSQLGSLKAAHAAAKGLQSAFSALRARTRRSAMRLNNEAEYSRDVKSIGPYDSLACVLSWLPEDKGCQIKLMPGSAYGMDFNVVDLSTGEPFKPEDPRLNRYIYIMQKLIHEDHQKKRENRQFVNPLTEEEMSFAWSYDPEHAKSDGIPKPQAMIDAAIPPRPASDYVSVDLADLEEDDLIMDQPEDLEPGKD